MIDDAFVFDADRHVIEPFDLWSKYLDPAFRDEAPTLVPDRGEGPADETMAARLARLGPGGMVPLARIPCWRGRPIWRDMSESIRIAVSRMSWQRVGDLHAASSGLGQLASMDGEGVHAAALMPTFGGFLVGIDDMPDAVAHAMAAAYNRWLADVCAADPARLVPVALMARHDPIRMVADLEATLERGWKAIVLRPEPVRGRGLGHPELEPFWSRCAEADVAVVLHGSTRARVPAIGADRFESQFALHACAHALEAMTALVALVDGGVLHRHPGMRILLLEAGCSWMPHWLWRLDEAWSVASDALRRGRPEKPSEVIRRACRLTVEADEPLLLETIAELGAERLLLGTDFPHYDHRVGVIEQFAGRISTLGRGPLEEIIGLNAAAFYRFAPDLSSKRS